MIDPLIAPWSEALQAGPGPLTLEWALVLAVAALTGHLVQHFTGLPKLIGYAVVGALAGTVGFAGAAWPLRGVGLYLLELGIAILLFEAGARLSLRWFRHNPMVLVQSLVESTLTFAAAYLALRALGVDLPVARALSMVAVAASPAVLGVSLLVGVLLAALLAGAFRLLQPTSQDTAIVILALIGACAAVTSSLGGSAPLATLLAGIVLKQFHPRPWVWPRQLGTASSMLTILMFVLVSSMAAQANWGGAITWAALALLGTRLAAKVVTLLVTGPASSLSLRQSLWVGVAMFPMSAVALLLTSQFVVASPTVGAQVAAIALPVILLTELLGAVLVGGALVHVREAERPSRQRGDLTTDDGGRTP